VTDHTLKSVDISKDVTFGLRFHLYHVYYAVRENNYMVIAFLRWSKETGDMKRSWFVDNVM
jgi:hypothetical protein